MAHEVGRQILELLYQRKDDPTEAALPGERLAQLLGKTWQEIKPEVEALQQAELVTTRSRDVDHHIYHFFTLTAAGIKEAGRRTKEQIDVFISSPGDVGKERDAATRAIQRCNDLTFVSKRYVLKALRYEDLVPPEVGEPPQPTVNRYMREAGNADIFICILSQRMGTRVLDESTGETYQSGTEYEFLSAYRSRQQRGKPYILLYRGMKHPRKPLNQEQMEQAERVNEFFKQFEEPNPKYKGLYKPYQATKTNDFENLLFRNLVTLLEEHFFD